MSGSAWGTNYSIKIVSDPNIPIDILKFKSSIDSIIIDIDNQMSTYKINSEISLFNSLPRNAAINISPGFSEVIKRSIYWSELTSGSFDITVFPAVINWRQGKNDREYEDIWEPPTDLEIIMSMDKIGYEKIKLSDRTLIKSVKGQMIDVNAIAKGWGVDRIFDYLQVNGITRFMVEIGGEIRVSGLNNKGQKWKIGIDKPEMQNQPGEKIYKVVALKDQSMATSGNYRNFFEYDGIKYSHIIDPRNGKSIVSDISSVTVVAPSCLDADVLATALSVMSYSDGLNLIDSLEGYEALWIITQGDKNFKAEATSGMPIMRD
jgi:thiamine biosynthesis lipoprotein